MTPTRSTVNGTRPFAWLWKFSGITLAIPLLAVAVGCFLQALGHPQMVEATSAAENAGYFLMALGFLGMVWAMLSSTSLQSIWTPISLVFLAGMFIPSGNTLSIWGTAVRWGARLVS